MLKSERRDQKRDRKVAKARRASNRKALFVLQQAAAKRLGLPLGARADRSRPSHPPLYALPGRPLPSFPRKRESRSALP